jgi:hypothetical protein
MLDLNQRSRARRGSRSCAERRRTANRRHRSSRGSGLNSKLSDPKQGAPEAAGASFFLTNVAARAALPVPLLSLEVINALAEIEPNNGIARTVTLRLRFIPKWSEWQSSGRRRCHDRHPKEKERAHSRGKTLCAKFKRAIVNRGQFT